MKEKSLFLNTYYFKISEEKERNKEVLYHFLYNTDYNEITDGDEISPINNYLVKVDDTIINLGMCVGTLPIVSLVRALTAT